MTQQELVEVWAGEDGKAYFWSLVPDTGGDFNTDVYSFLRSPEYDEDWRDGTILWDEQVKRWVYDGLTLYPSRHAAEAHK